jgi:DNA-binding beta-propeller fold protein YncE
MSLCAVRGQWCLALAVVLTVCAVPASASYVLFEGGQVRPLALSPDGSRLFAVNSPDNRLEIFAVSGAGLTKTGSVEVGMEPVAVAARNNNEVWVVNHLSDSVSIVDVSATPPRVTRTLLVGDEPRDIVFAGTGGDRAFITTARRGQNVPGSVPPLLTTEGTARALVFVFDATNLGNTLEGVPLTIVQLFGDTPRALAVSPSGATVYAAVFHSGNQTTTVNEGVVCDDTNLSNDLVQGSCTVLGTSYPGGLPNPERSADLEPRPETGLIVKFDEGAGQWRDQLSRNWNNAVRFELPDFDVFSIDANGSPPAQIGIDDVQHAHVGTVLFNMIANPASGKVYVSNTEAINEVRFEGPGLIGGTTVNGHLHEARITVLDGASVVPRPLNKHINYSVVPSPLGTADASLATPVGLAVNSTGSTLYVAAFGSQKVGVFDTTKLENDTFTTQPQDGVQHVDLGGGGPVGLALDETNDRLYVLTRFDNSVRVVDTDTLTEEVGLRRSLYNPESESITDGRPFLYDAALTSSNGEASCSSCHIFGDFDSLAWDLGNPDDEVLDNQNPILANLLALDPDFHPMKGPMTTQSLRGMANHGPMHWRGDRNGTLDEPTAQPNGGNFDEDLAFKKFNPAFEGLLGRDGELTAGEMQAFTDFILQVAYPPNPIRSLDNSLNAAQLAGRNLYLGPITDGLFNCNGCHVLDPAQGFFGGDGRSSFENEPQFFKIPHLRNMYQKVGMFGMPRVPFLGSTDGANKGRQVRGFGFLHDGAVDTMARFHTATVFSTNTTDEANIEQFMLAFDTNLAPIVGQQTTLTDTNSGLPSVTGRLDLLDLRAAQDECDVIVKGPVAGLQRGWLRETGGSYRSDRATEPLLTAANLRALAIAGQPLTYTCAPPGTGERMGVDRDEDGFYDRDELDAGSDPADPLAIPGGTTATLISAKKLLIKNKNPDDESKNKVVLLSKSTSITTPPPGSADDPRCNGDPSGTVKATLALSSATSGQSHTTDLPCENWALLGSPSNPKGYKYSDSEIDDGTAKKVIWKNGKQLKATLFGKGVTNLNYDLQASVSQGDVQAKFTSESIILCMSCAGLPGKDGSDAKAFLGKECPAPADCL